VKGAYILIIKLQKDMNIKIGKLGNIFFKAGIYAYVGSGMKNLISRVKSHFRKEKKLHWHIDYLLKKAKIQAVITIENDQKIECDIANTLSQNFKVIKEFGATDCRCKGHLFIILPIPTS